MISNPVLHKELLMKMRLRVPLPAKIMLGLTVGGSFAFLYWQALAWLIHEHQPTTGRDLWMIVMTLQFLVIGLIAPAATANAISQEHEQQSWEMLLFSRLRPSEIVFGKLLARVIPLFGLAALCLPMTLLALFHTYLNSPSGMNNEVLTQNGGLSIGQFLLGYAATGIMIFFFCTVGLYMSWRTKRTLLALMGTYVILVGGLTMGTAMVTGVLEVFFRSSGFFEKFPLMWINPCYLLFHVMNGSKEVEPGFIYIGLTLYALTTVFLLRRMLVRFRDNSRD